MTPKSSPLQPLTSRPTTCMHSERHGRFRVVHASENAATPCTLLSTCFMSKTSIISWYYMIAEISQQMKNAWQALKKHCANACADRTKSHLARVSCELKAHQNW